MNVIPPMSWRGHTRAVVVLGLPLIGSHVAQMLTHITDVVMLGWYSVDALAAVVLATQLFFVIFIVGSGFAFAVMPLCATAIGAGDDRQVRRSVRMGAWIVTIYGIILALPLWFLKPILLSFGQQTDLAQIAQDYMRIAMFGLFPALWIMIIKSYLSALERAQIVLIATLVAAAANVLFNYALIFGNLGFPEMGARGAAIASVLTISIDFLFLLAYCRLLPALKQYELFLNPFRFDAEAFRDTFRLGWPISLTMLAESSMFSVATLMVGWSGTIALASHGVVLQITSVGFMLPLGLSNVATIRAGRAFGRKDKLGLSRGAMVVIIGALAASLFTMMLYLAMPRTLMRLFIDPAEPALNAIVELGVLLLIFAAAFQVMDALQVVALGMLRGIKDTTIPMVLAVFSYWIIGVPTAYFLAIEMGYGPQGVWAGLAIGLSLAASTMLWRYFNLQRRLSF